MDGTNPKPPLGAGDGETALPVSTAGSQAPFPARLAQKDAGEAVGTKPPALVAPQLEGFEIIDRLGEGGMGAVWRAVQRSTRREVALKVIGAAGLGSHKARLRFEREIELSARLDHPGIARVYDGGLDRGVCFYAMELIDGVPLDQFARAIADRSANADADAVGLPGRAARP